MGSSNEDIVLAVETANFKCELDEGASEVASNDKKFEMNFDFRDFKREDIKITISKTIIKIVANSETETETSEFDEDIEIPARVLRETITCKINKKGVLRISAPLQPDTQEITSRTTSEKVTTQKKVVEGASKTVTTKTGGQEQEEVEEEEDASAKLTKAVSNKTEEKKVVVKQEKKIDQDGNILMKPNKANFTIDPKLVTDTPVFNKPEAKVGSITRLLSAYLKCTQYKPEEINVKISRSIIRIEARHESKTEKRSFFKEFNVPKGVKQEDIECEINESGILRITAPSTETTETQTVENTETTTKSDDVVVMAPKKIKFDCPPQEDISLVKELSFSHLNEKTVQMFANVSQYSSEEVLIRKTRRMIQMEGRHESNTATRSFYKEISIPADVDGNSLDCAINEKGIVRFTAPKIKTTKTILQPKIMESGGTTRTVTTTSSTSSSGQVVTSSSGPMTGNFGVNVVAQGYSPDEIKVSIANGWITINAKKEARIFGGENSFRNRSFTKKIQIPPNINPESLVFSMDDNTGSLSITSQ